MESNAIFESRDVQFNEDEFPFHGLGHSDPLIDYDFDDPKDESYAPIDLQQICTPNSHESSDGSNELDSTHRPNQAARPEDFVTTNINDPFPNGSPTALAGGPNGACGAHLSSDAMRVEPKRSTRKRKQRDLGFYVDSNCINSMAVTLQPLSDKIPVPKSINEALKSPYRQQWKEAIDSELASHHENRTWTLVDAPDHGRSIIGSMWVFKVIYNQTTGSVERFKARLVARGDSQNPVTISMKLTPQSRVSHHFAS
jgi:hypothetical protein